jgi:predicted ABC-type ATPase
MSSDHARPTLTIYAGPHGAGKSSLYEFERERTGQRLGPLVAGEDTPAIAALLSERKPLSIETTMSARADVDLVRNAKAAGYEVHVLQVGVADVDVAADRLRMRGGQRHSEVALQESFTAGLENTRVAVSLADKAVIYDNSKASAPLRPALALERGEVTNEANPPLWARLAYATELKAAEQREAPAPLPALSAFVSTLELSLAQHGRQMDHSAVSSDRAQFEGAVIGRTTTHTIQQTGPNNTVMHDNRRLDRVPAIGDHVLIAYDGPDQAKTQQRVDVARSGGRLAYEDYAPKAAREGEVTPMSQAMASSLRSDPLTDALKKFPELKPALQMLVAAKESQQVKAQPADNQVKILAAFRNKLAERIEHNQPLPSPERGRASSAELAR